MCKKTVIAAGVATAGVLTASVIGGAVAFKHSEDRFEAANSVTSAQAEFARSLQPVGMLGEAQVVGVVANMVEPANYLPKEIRELAKPEDQAADEAVKVFQESCAESKTSLSVSYGTVGASVYTTDSGRSMMVDSGALPTVVYLSREVAAAEHTGFSGVAWKEDGQFAEVAFADPAVFVDSMGSLEWQALDEETAVDSLAGREATFTISACEAG